MPGNYIPQLTGQAYRLIDIPTENRPGNRFAEPFLLHFLDKQKVEKICSIDRDIFVTGERQYPVIRAYQQRSTVLF